MFSKRLLYEWTWAKRAAVSRVHEASLNGEMTKRTGRPRMNILEVVVVVGDVEFAGVCDPAQSTQRPTFCSLTFISVVGIGTDEGALQTG